MDRVTENVITFEQGIKSLRQKNVRFEERLSTRTTIKISFCKLQLFEYLTAFIYASKQ